MYRIWAANLRQGRAFVGMTQVQLAEAVGVEQQTVSKWEAGVAMPRDLHKVKVAEALRQDVRQLFPLVRGAA